MFGRSGTTWSEEAKLTAPDAAAGDGFGFRVAIDGATGLVGANLDDDAGSDSGSAYVFVLPDTTPPVVTVSPDIIDEEATGPSGAAVTYTPATATDDVGVTVGPTCAPASGSNFSIGTTTVTCTASDAAGNVGSASFTVTVVDTTHPVVTVSIGDVLLLKRGVRILHGDRRGYHPSCSNGIGRYYRCDSHESIGRNGHLSSRYGYR